LQSEFRPNFTFSLPLKNTLSFRPNNQSSHLTQMGFWEWLHSWLEWLGLRNKNGKLLLLGLDDSGKTTLLYCLQTGKFMPFEQTQSYHVEKLTIEGINFSAWDLGGHEMARQSWSEYFLDVNAIVFMVDSSNRARFVEARTELELLLNNVTIQTVPILILANKVDKDGAVSQNYLCHGLGIHKETPQDATTIPQGERAIRVFPCSVKNKSGYADGFRWLAKFI
jgi:GTP-binding protein SAR1